MSIKKLFNKNRQGSRNYADYGSEKSTFEEVESARNSQQISIEKSTYSPQVDYSEPSNFVRFGSAELYYSGAMNRIHFTITCSMQKNIYLIIYTRDLMATLLWAPQALVLIQKRWMGTVDQVLVMKNT